MRFFTASIVTALAGLVSAFTQPDYSKPPSGNPILTPGLNQQVPVGKPFEITWTPTTQGTVTLVLLRGPSTDVVPLYSIADEIENTGKFTWTPKTDLVADTTHYGLLLVVDATRAYQYSTQFGIENPNSPSSASGSASGTASGTASETASVTGSNTVSGSATGTASSPGTTKTITLVGTGSSSVPVVSPTITPSLPSTLVSTAVSSAAVASSTPASGSSASASAAPQQTSNAGDRSVAHLGSVGVAAGLIALLAF